MFRHTDYPQFDAKPAGMVSKYGIDPSSPGGVPKL
jgi:hypothetical protein